MQVRDLIEQLKEYPEDWPVSYMAKSGTPLEIEVKRGFRRETAFVGIKITQPKGPKPYLPLLYKTRGQVKAEENAKNPQVGELRCYN